MEKLVLVAVIVSAGVIWCVGTMMLAKNSEDRTTRNGYLVAGASIGLFIFFIAWTLWTSHYPWKMAPLFKFERAMKTEHGGVFLFRFDDGTFMQYLLDEDEWREFERGLLVPAEPTVSSSSSESTRPDPRVSVPITLTEPLKPWERATVDAWSASPLLGGYLKDQAPDGTQWVLRLDAENWENFLFGNAYRVTECVKVIPPPEIEWVDDDHWAMPTPDKPPRNVGESWERGVYSYPCRMCDSGGGFIQTEDGIYRLDQEQWDNFKAGRGYVLTELWRDLSHKKRP